MEAPAHDHSAHEEHDHAHGGHGHGHGHNFFSRATSRDERQADQRRLKGTLALTLVMMVAEAVGGWLSGSLALLSDAGHMLTDVVSLVLAMVALWFSSRPADLKRTYGFYRLEILSAFVNGMTLIAIAGVVAYEAVVRLQHPPALRIDVMLSIAVLGLAVNIAGMVLLRRSHSMNLRGAFLHLVGDALSSVGVIIAAIVAWATGFTAIDPIVSLFIAAIIVFGALGLVREAVDVLLEAVPSHIDLSEVLAAMKSIDGVAAVHDLHLWTIANSMHALSAHLVVRDPGLVHNDRILALVKVALHERFAIDHTTLQIESEQYGTSAEAH